MLRKDCTCNCSDPNTAMNYSINSSLVYNKVEIIFIFSMQDKALNKTEQNTYWNIHFILYNPHPINVGFNIFP